MPESKEAMRKGPDTSVEDVLKELEDEGFEVEGREKPAPKETPKEGEGEPQKPAEGEKPKEGAPKEDAGKEGEGEPRKPRTPKTMFAWEHEKTVKQMQAQHEKELAEAVERGRREALGPKPTPKENEGEDPASKIAKKWNVDVEFVRELQGIFGTPNLPKEVEEKLARLDTLTSKATETIDDLEFNKEFDKVVRPLVESEYQGISPAQFERIRARMQKVAFTEDYARVPLSVIYQGIPEFRGLVTTPKKTMEGGKGGTERTEKVLNFDDVGEEDILAMSDEDFESFLKTKMKKSK